MTVCISAFAAKAKAIVLVADKMLTYDPYGPSPMQSDTGISKILHLADSGWEALFAGRGAFAEKVVNQANIAFLEKRAIAISYEEVTDCITNAYQQVREREVVDTVLRPRLLDKDSFIKRSSQDLQPLNEELSREIVQSLLKYDTGCTLMVCGFDRYGPHIFTIGDNGVPSSHDLEGFCAIGIGEQAATSRLLWEEVDRNDPLATAIYNVFHAKVQAEIIQGVGYLWDAHVLVSGQKLIRVKGSVVRAIENLFEDSALSPFDKTRRKTEAKRKQWIDAVVEFAKEAMERKRPRKRAKLVKVRRSPRPPDRP